MASEEQDIAEALDADKYGEEMIDENLADYPPDVPLGVEDDDVTPLGEANKDTLEERIEREEPDPLIAALDAEVAEEDRARKAFDDGRVPRVVEPPLAAGADADPVRQRMVDGSPLEAGDDALRLVDDNEGFTATLGEEEPADASAEETAMHVEEGNAAPDDLGDGA